MTRIQRGCDQIIISRATPLPVAIFMLVWEAIFAGIPLFLFISQVAQLGEWQFTCHKRQPQVSDCTAVFQPAVGIFPTTNTAYTGISKVESSSETRKDSDGDTYTVSYLVLHGESLAKISLDSATVNQLANSLTQYLKSDEAKLLFTKTYAVNTGVITTSLFLLVFIVVGIAALAGTLAIESLILDSSNRSITCSRIGLPTYRITLPFWEVDSLKVEEHVGEDDTCYSLHILSQTQRKYLVKLGMTESEARELGRELSIFIGCRLELPSG